MITTTRLTTAVVAVAALTVIAVGLGTQNKAGATPEVTVQEANPTITITNEGGSPPYIYSPTELEAKVGQTITVTNNDPNGVHTVTAKDRSFSVDVPPQGSATFTVSAPGNYPYYCTYHTDSHNAASLNVT